MAGGPRRTVDPQREIRRDRIYDDDRPTGRKVTDALTQQWPATAGIAAAGLALTAAPSLFVPALLIGGVWGLSTLDRYRFEKGNEAPFRLPADSGLIDPGDPKPGRRSFNKARGVIAMGNRLGDDAEVWQGGVNSDAVRHWMVFGTTGAGKAQPEYARVLTPSGWKAIGSLSPGDEVVGGYGGITTISEVHPQGDLPVWKVVSRDGRVAHCCPDHLWQLADGTVVTTKMLRTLARPTGALRWRHKRPKAHLAAPVAWGGETQWDAIQIAAAISAWRAGQVTGAPTEAFSTLSQASRVALVEGLLEGTSDDGSVVVSKSGERAHLRFPTEDAAEEVQRLLWASGCTHCHRNGSQMAVDVGHVTSPDMDRYVEVADVIETTETAFSVCLSLNGEDLTYITDDHLVTHNTNTLLSVVVGNMLAMGSGVIYSDAKATPDLIFKIAGMARRMGRDDDVFVCNYFIAARGVAGERTRSSNTSNLYATGTADEMVQVTSGLLPKSGGENQVFAERALALLSTVLYPLQDLRDAGYVQLGVLELRDALSINALIDFATNHDLPISANSRLMVTSYLSSLAGFSLGAMYRAAEQGQLSSFQIPQEASRQFGFAQMYFTRAISALADVYGHIYCVNRGEMTPADLVINRRIGVYLLPSLGKSVQELQNLGKINLSAIRNAMKLGLGRGIEGDRRVMVEAVPTISTTPVALVMDEVAFQMVEGLALAAAQSRGLNIWCIFAAQDKAGMKRVDEGETEQIMENTNTKVYMKLEGSNTFEQLKSTVGEAVISTGTGGHMLDGDLFDGRISNREYRYDKVSRVDITDVRELIEGEAYITYGNRLILTQMLNSGCASLDNLRVNRFLRIAPPPKGAAPSDITMPRLMDDMLRERRVENDEPERIDGRKSPKWLQTLRTSFDQAAAAKANPTLAALATALSLSLSDLDDERPAPDGAGASGDAGRERFAQSVDSFARESQLQPISGISDPFAEEVGDDADRSVAPLLPSVSTIGAVFGEDEEDDGSWMPAAVPIEMPANAADDGSISDEFRGILSELDEAVDIDRYVEQADSADDDLLAMHSPRSARAFSDPAAITLETALDAYLNTALGDQLDDESLAQASGTAQRWIEGARYYPSSPTPDEAEDDVSERQRLCLEALMTLSDTGL